MEKLIPSKMMLPGSNRRIHSVHRHSGMVLCHLDFYILYCFADLVTLLLLLLLFIFIFFKKIVMTIKGLHKLDTIDLHFVYKLDPE